MDKDFKMSEKDKELTNILDSKKDISVDKNTPIDIKLPKDKGRIKKALAFLSAAVLGTAGLGATASSAKKTADATAKQTEDIICEVPTYEPLPEGQEKYYVESGKVLKMTHDVDDSEYVKVFSSSSSPETYGDTYAYTFKTPEYPEELFVPTEDVATYITLQIDIDDPTAECTNFRSTPKKEKDNVARKIPQTGKVYIKPGPVERTNDYCWFEALYAEDGNLVSGYYCVQDDEFENKYLSYKSDDIYSYAYVVNDARLYTKEEVSNMYYKVTATDGVPFTKTAGDLENFSYIPNGAIIKGTINTKVQKSHDGDQYAWIQCTTEIDGEEQLGFVPYRSIYSNPLIKRIPPEEVNEKTNSNTK